MEVLILEAIGKKTNHEFFQRARRTTFEVNDDPVCHLLSPQIDEVDTVEEPRLLFTYEVLSHGGSSPGGSLVMKEEFHKFNPGKSQFV